MASTRRSSGRTAQFLRTKTPGVFVRHSNGCPAAFGRGRCRCEPSYRGKRRSPATGKPEYRSTIHAFACRALHIRHLRTRPYRPRTNGKAERFIRTLLAGWAYGAIYGSSRERAAALDGWLWTYNHRRPHGALSHKTPIARLNELNNLAGFYT